MEVELIGITTSDELSTDELIEHASAAFEIGGISRACSHQLVRHRIASYSQESQRYVDLSHPYFVVPHDVANDPEAMEIWNDFMERVQSTYHALRKRGVKKEDCRFVLPNATATRIVVTMNFRELWHVFRLRISPQAQWEIREVCVHMLAIMSRVAPNVFGDVWEELRARYPSFFRGFEHG